MNEFTVKYSAEWGRLINDSFLALVELKKRQLQMKAANQPTGSIDNIIKVMTELTEHVMAPSEFVLMQMRIDKLESTNIALAGELLELKKEKEVNEQIKNL